MGIKTRCQEQSSEMASFSRATLSSESLSTGISFIFFHRGRNAPSLWELDDPVSGGAMQGLETVWRSVADWPGTARLFSKFRLALLLSAEEHEPVGYTAVGAGGLIRGFVEVCSRASTLLSRFSSVNPCAGLANR